MSYSSSYLKSQIDKTLALIVNLMNQPPSKEQRESLDEAYSYLNWLEFRLKDTNKGGRDVV
tara:strand:+ start:173 stop:355 length:183 start_codon:yes stop_codon:yes gene_type:complete